MDLWTNVRLQSLKLRTSSPPCQKRNRKDCHGMSCTTLYYSPGTSHQSRTTPVNQRETRLQLLIWYFLSTVCLGGTAADIQLGFYSYQDFFRSRLQQGCSRLAMVASKSTRRAEQPLLTRVYFLARRLWPYVERIKCKSDNEPELTSFNYGQVSHLCPHKSR